MKHTRTKAAIAAMLLGLGVIVTAYSARERTVAPNQATGQETDSIVLGMGCFWGAEKRMGELAGVVDVESGYAGGDLPGAGYQQILEHERALRAGKATARNHAEVVKVSFDPAAVTLEAVLARFWENHDPTQGDRQGNDVGSNYRSAVYYRDEIQQAAALATRDAYQRALGAAGYGRITTEILPLRHYTAAEAYHQDYLRKNPDGYCGLGGTGVKYPAAAQAAATPVRAPAGLDGARLDPARQLIVFEAEDCEFCKQFDADVLSRWQADVPVVATLGAHPPAGWTLEQPLFAAPTIVLFREGREVARYTGYNGEKANFWKWLGFQLLSPEQQRIAFEQGTEPPFTATNLDEKRPGTFVDPITGAPLFLSRAKFESGTGWPSFFDPIEGAVTEHPDRSHGMRRIEVRSASSGIHLGHVFDDGPPPTYKRYCINGNVLKFVPDPK
ncbi:peptide-methionine (S)-S-oxide reductase MsrA [Nitrosovibrio sp. Nv17]|uniref:peptide-methionine (S)-S-oxide reductase MsrA n=1 Tax=Nitrosovibrio sp. Nv17 TaxID=1855339 RepID=UPI000908C36F|nr:peptide-methionine (S)-S-oxide reductase MsrA [Nitrosovibrio sp. Nv17]SFW13871.1 peptide methionine sulfoxide reductase msrA/msrB [Nitrosovibrio sp. Nv17]